MLVERANWLANHHNNSQKLFTEPNVSTAARRRKSFGEQTTLLRLPQEQRWRFRL
jgi:hypothetical protein